MSILASSSPLSCLRVSSSPVSKPTTPSPLALLRFRRYASTSTSTTSSSSASPSGITPDGSQRLDWNTFFKLRKARRRWQVAFSALAMLASGTGGAIFLSTGAADPVLSQIPLDPFITLGMMVLGFSALGWLAGPSLGSAVFNMLNRQWKRQITMKEVEFFARVKKNRVDPSASGASNPVPDFYGEKISSVAGYRQWLKDQRAFNKKRTRFV
ncbi:hypothetical protein ACRALDRAFT_1028978 [Sodiomyces alcalophilus JCM 7366]|uniref:uncharacterized protein n=1 Tax=Sodiomyces alcalophilus JCM 7366 TaxID=591952 RepID=UPI0039B5CBBB